MNRQANRGFVLYTSLVIAFLTMLWAVAAVYRINHQTGATLHSYQKSEVYYLAKQAASRSLAMMNSVPGWINIHTSPDSADTTTPGTKAWVEASGTELVLMVEATVERKKRTLKIPIIDNSDPSTKLFSLSPSTNGPDVISWATTAEGDWQGLPPIPGAEIILSTAVTKDGDVFAATGDQSTSILWRYRTGQGWIQMPDLPSGVQLTELSCSGNSHLVGKGSDNTLKVLPLGDSAGVSMTWDSVSAPGGSTLEFVEADPNGSNKTLVTTTTSADPKMYVYNGGGWVPHAIPTGVDNLDGGLTVDGDGNAYVATNSTIPGVPAVIYKRESTSAGISSTDWEALPPVPAIEWVGGTATNPNGFVETIVRIEDDPKDGSLWVQWDNPGGQDQHNLVNFPVP
jgi:hypothetical protein